jgi:ankyrin repeat protein
MNAVKLALAALPPTLDETYTRILDKIAQSDKQRVYHILQWLCFGLRTLTLDEVVAIHHVAHDSDPPIAAETKLFDVEDIWDICGGIITTFPPGQRSQSQLCFVQLSHFSVKEFLLSPRAGSWSMTDLPAAHLAIIQTATTYFVHILPLRENRERKFDAYKTEIWSQEYTSLASYLCRFLPSHLSTLSSLDHPELFHSLQRLFDPQNCCNDFIHQLWFSRIAHRNFIPEEVEAHSALALSLNVAAHLGLTSICDWLLSSDGADAELHSVISISLGLGPPLFEAMWGDHIGLLDFLIDRGADINQLVGIDTALFNAISRRNAKTVKTLLDRGANVNQLKGYDPPIWYAASYEDWEIVQLLVKYGADVNHQSGGCKSVIQLAGARGADITVVRMLIEAGADVNLCNESNASALQESSFLGMAEIVLSLLDAGADVNKQGGTYQSFETHFYPYDEERIYCEGRMDFGSSLQAASHAGHKDIVSLLLQAGADVNATGEQHGSSLQAASYRGHRDIVSLLLQAGADVNATGGEHGSSLEAAWYAGNNDIFKLLLQAGADVGPLFQEASYRGHTDMIRRLIQAIADVNATGEEYSSSLQVASYRGHKDIVSLLIHAGADVNATGVGNGSSLQAASYGGHTDIVSSCSRQEPTSMPLAEGTVRHYKQHRTQVIQTLSGSCSKQEPMSTPPAESTVHHC